jgi:hypothetical protein
MNQRTLTWTCYITARRTLCPKISVHHPLALDLDASCTGPLVHVLEELPSALGHLDMTRDARGLHSRSSVHCVP